MKSNSDMEIRYPRYLSVIVLPLVFFLTITFSYAAAMPEKAKDFELEGLDGNTYRLSNMKGKVVLINFWATWCTYCVKENPALDRLYNKLKDQGFIVLGISVDRSVPALKNFLLSNPVSYPVLLDSQGDVFVKTYTVIGIPVTFLINKEGEIVRKFMGGQDFDSDKFIKEISELL